VTLATGVAQWVMRISANADALDALFAETAASQRSGAGGALRGVAPHGSGLSRRRARRVLALIDTVHGRYLLVTKPNLDCARWTTVLPGTERATRNAVAELLAEAQPRQESWLS